MKQSWLEKLSASVGETLGAERAEGIMAGSGGLSSNSGPRRKAEWVVQAMQRLTEACDPETVTRIMQGCSCPYSKKRLKGLKRIYEEGGIRAFVKAVQDSRIQRIRTALGGDDELLRRAEGEAWFLSPTLEEGERIVITTIPYHVRAYMNATSAEKKRLHYCHCGWVNASREPVPLLFCSCGVGYHRQLLEGVFERPVDVEIVQTVMSGADICRFSCAVPGIRDN